MWHYYSPGKSAVWNAQNHYSMMVWKFDVQRPRRNQALAAKHVSLMILVRFSLMILVWFIILLLKNISIINQGCQKVWKSGKSRGGGHIVLWLVGLICPHTWYRVNRSAKNWGSTCPPWTPPRSAPCLRRACNITHYMDLKVVIEFLIEIWNSEWAMIWAQILRAQTEDIEKSTLIEKWNSYLN